MFAHQSLKKHAPFIVGGAYTLQTGTGSTAAVVRSTYAAGASSFTEEWVMAAGASATLTFPNASYGSQTVALGAAPDHLPWPVNAQGGSVGALTASRKGGIPAASLTNGFTAVGAVRTVTTTAQVQAAPAVAPAVDALATPARRAETLYDAAGTVVGSVYAEWDASNAKSPVSLWQLVKTTSFTQGAISRFDTAAPPTSLSAWYAATLQGLGGSAGVTLVSGTATRT